MPLGDLIGETLGGLFRVLGRLLFELLFEVILQGTGHVLIRLARPRSNPGEAACAIVGTIFWLVAGVAGYALYRALAG